jgi:hypothetical protein
MAEIVPACADVEGSLLQEAATHGFNRLTSDGIVHVVLFWMASFEPPVWTEVPGLRKRRYGKFRLDFGVWVPELTRMGSPRSAWINEYDCQLRRTIGQLMTGEDVDSWWDLSDPAPPRTLGRHSGSMACHGSTPSRTRPLWPTNSIAWRLARPGWVQLARQTFSYLRSPSIGLRTLGGPWSATSANQSSPVTPHTFRGSC